MKIIDFENHAGLSGKMKHWASLRKVPPIYHYETNCIEMPDGRYIPIGESPSIEERVIDMDKVGLDIAILSSPALVEALDPSTGAEVARILNDALAKKISKYPERFRGYATLPISDISASIYELERCNREYGFVGWLAFSNFGETGLDDDIYLPVLEKIEALGMFIYLHPAFSTYKRLQGCGMVLAGPGLGFSIDVSITLLRMIFKGVFDRFPNLNVILGHLGEGFPYYLDRLDRQYKKDNISRYQGLIINQHVPSYYFKRNVYITTSGSFSSASFNCAKDIVGIRRIMFASDYPMEELEEMVDFVENLRLTSEERDCLYYKNARTLLNIEIKEK